MPQCPQCQTRLSLWTAWFPKKNFVCPGCSEELTYDRASLVIPIGAGAVTFPLVVLLLQLAGLSRVQSFLGGVRSHPSRLTASGGKVRAL